MGQHLYIDQGANVSATTLRGFLDDLRRTYGLYEGPATTKGTLVTEFGWTSPGVDAPVQADNLQSAFAVFRALPYVRGAFWFTVQDIPEASIYYGLHAGGDPATASPGREAVPRGLPVGHRAPPSCHRAALGPDLQTGGRTASSPTTWCSRIGRKRYPGAVRPLPPDGRRRHHPGGRRTPGAGATTPTGATCAWTTPPPAGPRSGLADGAYLDWIPPEEAGCIDWRKVDAGAAVSQGRC